ncbi:protein of unknown function (plasmid) [Cupriavidus neocaledonicus]|uniref:Uncharacterized protein n=1 Tax=Cupriavidus neocaledonicus TaxID=1040979 RepID=A0A375HP09_9BURK|nr:protein of unknown function [Cupriavidus neocaledonicus]
MPGQRSLDSVAIQDICAAAGVTTGTYGRREFDDELGGHSAPTCAPESVSRMAVIEGLSSFSESVAQPGEEDSGSEKPDREYDGRIHDIPPG